MVTDIPHLLMAFPTSNTELAVIFSENVDKDAEKVENYTTEMNLKILSASINKHDKSRVNLTTEQMNGDLMKIDSLQTKNIHTISGNDISKEKSPQFIQGIANITETQKNSENEFPFSSRFNKVVTSMSCQKNGGADSSKLIDALGFSFIHRETGGPFNSIKVLCKKHVPGIEKETERLRPQRKSPHVLWSGGVIENFNGETRLADTGYMEGSVMPATPKNFPPTTLAKTVEITGNNSSTLKAKSLQGVIVRFDNVVIDSILSPDEKNRRRFVFHDDGGNQVPGLMLDTVTKDVNSGQKFQSMRCILHMPEKNNYEAIVELNEHLSETQITY